MRLKFFIGCNDKDTHIIKISKEYCFNTIVKIFNDYYDGYSISEQYGIYKGELELSYQVTILTDVIDSEVIHPICDRLKDELNQECIGVEICENRYEFI